MHKVYRSFLVLLSIATGVLFLYSAYTKFFPVQAFEYTMAQFIHMPMIVAKIAARFFIGLEAALGGLMILHFLGKNNWPLKAAFVLVSVFSIYLIYLWASAGNNVNCGCFGDAIWMSPSTSLIKNAGILIALGILIRYHRGFQWQWTKISGPVILLCTVALPYFLSPILTRYKIDLSPLYANGKTDKPAIDLAKGKHIIAFLNPQCMHCRKAGLKMHTMFQKDTTLPFFLVIGGTVSNLTDFWKDSQAQDMPHTRLDAGPFNKITGGVYPQIYWVNNSWVEENVSYPDLDANAVERWEKTKAH